MKCVRCQRPITTAAVWVGSFAYGPKCARKAGHSVPAAPRATAIAAQAGQMHLALAEPAPARQGHRYQHYGVDVLVLEPGFKPLVGVIGDPWFTSRMTVDAGELVPSPLKYLQGAIPP